ncbi:MAG: hypothetical protein V1722_01890 [Candidatus Micrarchaeota archaeon]
MHEIVDAIAKLKVIGLVSIVRRRHVNNHGGKADFLEVQQKGEVTRSFRDELIKNLRETGFKVDQPDHAENPYQIHVSKVEGRKLLPDLHRFYAINLKEGQNTRILIQPFKARKMKIPNRVTGKPQFLPVQGEPRPIGRWEERQLRKRIKPQALR